MRSHYRSGRQAVDLAIEGVCDMTALQRASHELEDHQVLVEVKHLKMHFPVMFGVIVQQTVDHVKAVDGVSCIVQLYRPTTGTVLFNGKDLCKLLLQAPFHRAPERRQRLVTHVVLDALGIDPRRFGADTKGAQERLDGLVS